MGIFRHFPYTNFHEMNLDWIINRIKDLWKGVENIDKRMDDFIADTEPAIRDEVDKWLDDHPEATTTVQDGAITKQKLNPKFLYELESESLKNTLQNLTFAPFTRHFVDTSQLDISGIQVSTMSEDERYIFVIMPINGVTTTTNHDSWFCTIDPKTGKLLNKKLLPIGHGRSMTIKNGKILLATKYEIANNVWVVVNVDDPLNPVIESSGIYNCAHLFWTENGAGYYDYSSNQIIYLDVIYDSNGKVEGFESTGKYINVPQGVRGEEQSFQYYKSMIIVASTLPEKITFLNAETGEILATNQLKNAYGFLRVEELESAFIVNDHVYITNNGLSHYDNGVMIRNFNVFRGDIKNNLGEWYDFWTGRSYRADRGSRIKVSGDIEDTPVSSVSFTGSSEAPYPLVEDAVISYTARQRVNYPNYQPNTERLVIDLINTNYNHEIIISTAPFNIELYGVSNKTKTRGVWINSVNFVSIGNIIIEKSKLAGYGESLIGLVASASNVFIQSSCEFTNTSGVSVRAQNNSYVNIGLSVDDLTINESTIVVNGTWGNISPKRNGIIERANSNYSAYSGKAGLLQTGATDGTLWFRTLNNDNSMDGLFATSSGVEWRHYPNYTNTDNYTVKGRANWN